MSFPGAVQAATWEFPFRFCSTFLVSARKVDEKKPIQEGAFYQTLPPENLPSSIRDRWRFS
jgi:hypothetical protein